MQQVWNCTYWAFLLWAALAHLGNSHAIESASRYATLMDGSSWQWTSAHSRFRFEKKSERNWLFMYIEKGNLITSLKPNVASVYFFFQCTYIVTACGMNDDGLVLVKVFKIFRAANLGKRKTVSDHCQLRAWSCWCGWFQARVEEVGVGGKGWHTSDIHNVEHVGRTDVDFYYKSHLGTSDCEKHTPTLVDVIKRAFF